MKRTVDIAFLIAVAVTGCSRTAVSNAVPQTSQMTSLEPSISQLLEANTLGQGKIHHVIVIVQENRTVDNLFNGLPGANTVQSGKNSYGVTLQLRSVSLTAPYDIGHEHKDWLVEYNHGGMNGFNLDSMKCYSKKSGGCPPANIAAYSYVPKDEVTQYWTLAQSYVFADNAFETSQGPSFPAHQYLVSGTSATYDGSDVGAANNAKNPGSRHEGGCDSTNGTTVQTITDEGYYGQPTFPCFKRHSILGNLDADKLSWHYYQQKAGRGQWNAPDALKDIRYGQSYQNVIWPSKKFLKDIAKGELAQVTYITPTDETSDHPAHNNGSGPRWVASVVNAIGESKYWDSSAIFVVWDDWGGWYDHVSPHIYNGYELSFRVPMIVVSPYAKSGYISHQQHEFGSILKFIEEALNVQSLHTTDVRSDNFSDCFDFSQAPRKFQRIPGAMTARDFTNQTQPAQVTDGDEPD
jgi:phospholipase C